MAKERKLIYDLTGKTYNNIYVIKRDINNSKHGTYFLCKCLMCGNTFSKSSSRIMNDVNYSCGCKGYRKSLIGQRFGKLLVKKLIKTNSHGERVWECLCDCGNITNKMSNQLTKGIAIRCPKCGHKLAGIKNSKPLKYSKRLYECYVNMKTRTTNSKQDKHNRYINRNIKMCNEWKNDYYVFEKWALENGYNDALTLDRINNNGDYEPSNCRWVDRTIQANNRRTNVVLEYNGEKHTMAEWSKITSIPYYYFQKYRDIKTLEELKKHYEYNSRHKRKE